MKLLLQKQKTTVSEILKGSQTFKHNGIVCFFYIKNLTTGAINILKLHFTDALTCPQDAELILFNSEQLGPSLPERTFWGPKHLTAI